MRAPVLLAALLAGTAQAMCAGPQPVLLPPEGGVLPPNPQLFLFLPEQGPYRGQLTPNEKALRDLEVVTAEGTALPVVFERLVDGNDVDVYRLSIRAEPGAQFLVRPFQSRLSSIVRLERATSLSIERGPEKNYRWTCSYESTRVIVPSLEAPAFRITWARELCDVDSHEARSLILPGRDAWFSGREEDAPRRLRLGHLNCASTNLEWSKPIFVRVTALMPDGTEVPSRQVLRLEPPPLPSELGTW